MKRLIVGGILIWIALLFFLPQFNRPIALVNLDGYNDASFLATYQDNTNVVRTVGGIVGALILLWLGIKLRVWKLGFSRLRIMTVSLLVLVLLSTSVAVYALTYKTIPFDFVVVTPPQIASIEVYSDNVTTVVLVPPLHFMEGRQTSIWLKNIGTAAGNVTMVAKNSSGGNLNFNPLSFSLLPGQVQKVDLTLAVSSNMTSGNYSDSFHVVQLLKLERVCWLYITFATRQNYDLFWIAGYITIICLLILDRVWKKRKTSRM